MREEDCVVDAASKCLVLVSAPPRFLGRDNRSEYCVEINDLIQNCGAMEAQESVARHD